MNALVTEVTDKNTPAVMWHVTSEGSMLTINKEPFVMTVVYRPAAMQDLVQFLQKALAAHGISEPK